MNALRYICLSDLHLGAPESLFTQVDDQGLPDHAACSDALKTFGALLREYVASMTGDGPPPQLILLGDVLDMGLSPVGDTAAAYERFIEVLFPPGPGAVFSRHVLCVPGNHDHLLWSMAKQDHFQQQLKRHYGELPEDDACDRGLPQFMPVTPLFADNKKSLAPCELLTTITRARTDCPEARVDMAYPNMGLFDASSGRCVLLHHGHYTDPTYRAMSVVNSAVSGVPSMPPNVAQLERQNGPWIDFLWSDLGDAGVSGRSANTLYEVMNDAYAARLYCRRFASAALQRLRTVANVDPSLPVLDGITLGQVLHGLFDVTAARGAESSRDGDMQLMSRSAMAQLHAYMSGPLLEQLRASPPLGAVKETAFIFGHTHKPFQRELCVDGFERPVCVYNTGGWVMDQPCTAPPLGASAVFIDKDLHVASLRLFNNPVNGDVGQVRVEGTQGFSDPRNPLLETMTLALEPMADQWAKFSQVVKEAIESRAAWQAQRFESLDRAALLYKEIAS